MMTSAHFERVSAESADNRQDGDAGGEEEEEEGWLLREDTEGIMDYPLHAPNGDGEAPFLHRDHRPCPRMPAHARAHILLSDTNLDHPTFSPACGC